eukprot:CAMPEP_0196141160 /NCGR_PEP_ID=MMETSP0910-20130528/8816_1 /TAXON_ID=49265 /ORGANISM="Thalassiosira rotula, Strain GSO102" /LENGTH=59 /DNA_ID=CAMNT_0041402225 /DNA_START=127 /DNA_END=303 /DNA_ORIENTATION=+
MHPTLACAHQEPESNVLDELPLFKESFQGVFSRGATFREARVAVVEVSIVKTMKVRGRH